MRTYKALLWWCETDQHMRRWRIWLTSDDLHEFMRTDAADPYDGLILYEQREIFLFAGQRRAKLLDSVLHELGHANNYRRGIETKAQEEAAIRAALPLLFPTIMRHGWKPPPLPDGWRSLAAHARHVRYGRRCREADE